MFLQQREVKEEEGKIGSEESKPQAMVTHARLLGLDLAIGLDELGCDCQQNHIRQQNNAHHVHHSVLKSDPLPDTQIASEV